MITFLPGEGEAVRVPKLDALAADAVSELGLIYTVAELGDIVPEMGLDLYCSDEAGGFVRVFADGENWRRYTDRAVIS